MVYGWAQDNRGERLRTFITRPNTATATGKVPAIFFVGWLSCDSVEYPDATTKDGFGILLRRLIEQSGYATVRIDKPGVGESQGDCSKTDFAKNSPVIRRLSTKCSSITLLMLQRSSSSA